MTAIVANTNRHAKFTSSQMHKLIKTGRQDLGFGAPAITYIKEKVHESRLQSALSTDPYSRSMAWGEIMELVVFNELGMEYVIVSNESKSHPDKELSEWWSGSCDLKDRKGEFIAEIKCYQKKHYAEYTNALMKGDVAYLRDNHPEEYWQIVSNTIIHDVKIGEGITFMPYRSQLPELIEIASDPDIWGSDQWKYRFIAESKEHELALLPDDGYYKSITKFKFEVPQEDKVKLTDAVQNAITLFKKYEKQIAF